MTDRRERVERRCVREKERLLVVRILWWMDWNVFSTIRTEICLEEDDLYIILD